MQDLLSAAQQHTMLRGLMEDRFQLRLRRETREMPVFALVVGKGGSKLKPNATDSVEKRMRTVRGSWSLENVQVADLAGRLSRQLGRMVLDRTGLNGRDDIRLEWAVDEGAGPSPAGASRASIVRAVQELGLKLESTKGPVEILMIDRVERPSAN